MSKKPEVPTLRVGIIGARGYPSHYGGFETAVRHLVPFLCERGWEVTIYARADHQHSLDTIPSEGVLVRSMPGLESKSLSTISHGLTSFLAAARDQQDVLLVLNVANGFWLPVSRIFRIPSLVNVDGIEWERAKWGKVAKAAFRLGARLTALFATRLVFDAEAIGARWKREFKREGIFIPYGGELEGAVLVPEDLPSKEYVLAVARLVPENSIDAFLDAVAHLDPKTTIVLVGSSGYGDAVEDRIKDLEKLHPNFHWLGHIASDERLHGLWSHAGVYFHGHSVGGTNPALVQAMASGSPVVARDTIFNREVLGDGGSFVEPDGPSIARELTRVLRDREGRDAMVNKQYERVRKIYNWHNVSDSYERALRTLAVRAHKTSMRTR